MRIAPAACVLFAALAAAWTASGLIGGSSPTYDEPVHLAAGYTDLVDGRYRLNSMDHPPLGEMWAALPLLALRPDKFFSHPAWLDGAVYHYGDLFLYHNRVPAGRLLGAARAWNLLTLTLLLAACVAAWARRLDGEPAAWAAAAALGLCVPWLSNAALVTTDSASAALFFCCFCALAAPRRTAAVWILAGAAAGAALAAKFNMILLPPLAALALAAESRADRSRRPRAAHAAAATAAALLVLAAAYRFGAAGLYPRGLSATLSRLSEGRAAYLLGRHSTEGWWWYFLAAVLVKTPPALLLLGAAGVREALRKPRAQAAWLLIPPAGYLVAALASKTQIGYRHLLPMYPFLCLWAGLGAASLWRRGAPGRAALAAAALWLSGSAVSARAHPLAYFNSLARGGGEAWLSDSNLDWGQDLPALARELAARGNPPIVLSYFGSGDPAAYGIRYVPLAIVANVERRGNAAVGPEGPTWLAVSETNLVGTYYRDHSAFDWLRGRAPAAVAGGSIFLYDLSGDAAARSRVAAMLAAAGPPPKP